MKNIMQKLGALESRFSQSAAVQKAVSAFGTPRGFIAVLLLILFVYAFRVDYSPGLHGDEASVLAIPYRAVVYNDLKYPLIFSHTYNAGEVRHYPPVLSMMLRSWWHEVVGFSGHSSRLFSGLMMAILAGLSGWLFLRRSGGDWRFAVMGLACVGLNPALIMAARTVRFEQEVFFLGCLSFLLPLLFARASNPGLSRIVWVAAGFSAAFAGFSHPWGMVFPAVLVFSFIIWHAAWKEQDGIGLIGRLFFFGLGTIVPMAATAAQVLQNWPEFLSYVAETKAFYAVREPQLVQYFLNRYNIPLDPNGWAGRIVTVFLQLHMTGHPATATKLSGIDVIPMIGVFFQLLFWGFLATVLMAWRGIKGRDLASRLFVFLSTAFVIFGAFYMPNQTYAIFGGMAVVLCALFLSGQVAWLRGGLRAYTALCAFFALSYVVYLAVYPGLSGHISFDARNAAMAEMNEAVGLERDADGAVYVDSYTWYAGGKNAKAYLDIFRDGKIDPSVRGFVVNSETLNLQMAQQGDANQNQDWRKIMEGALSHNVLRGVIALEKDQVGIHYLMPTTVGERILVTFFDDKGEKRQFRASYKDMVPLRANLSPRWYLVMGLPGRGVDYHMFRKVDHLNIRYSKNSDKTISVAIIEVTDNAVVPKANPNAILIPLLEGWK